MEGTDPILVECVGGSHDGRTWPMHPAALADGSPVILPSHGVFLAMTDTPEDDPVNSPPDRTWERYVLRGERDGWHLHFDGRLDHLQPPAPSA